ncbi:MAG: maleylpyruvate isomerase family mycothiol-dependent enzyme [Actinomycetota bacterium]|nr:maleylpyruvate isomerase family mycothiol-dependent enzyme [Actinomycetota bacterium]
MIDHVSHLRYNGELLGRAAENDLEELGTPIPSCPGWNMGKLLVHMGQHHRWVADSLRKKGAMPDTPGKPGLRGALLLDWFRQGWAELADLLEGMDDSEPAWSWSREQTVGFWRRRTSLETLVHRWDAENALGPTNRFNVELAADCADEVLFVMLPEAGQQAIYRGPSGSACLSCRDHPSAWTLVMHDGEAPKIQRGPPDVADVTVSADAEGMALLLWGRGGEGDLDIAGDDQLGEEILRWIHE